MLHISFKTRIIFFILLLKQSVIDLIANVLRMCLFVFCSFCFALNSIFSQNYSIRVESITIIVGHDQASWKRASILCFLSNSKQNLVPLDQRVFVFLNAFCDKNSPKKSFVPSFSLSISFEHEFQIQQASTRFLLYTIWHKNCFVILSQFWYFLIKNSRVLP